MSSKILKKKSSRGPSQPEGMPFGGGVAADQTVRGGSLSSHGNFDAAAKGHPLRQPRLGTNFAQEIYVKNAREHN
ncbi:MAG: hypothetical protein KBD07_02025, partial [Candidatus Omnitrophica bacterium]|nr:hypothetical protein [Candidatus Omnitrophota bacterium]